MSHYYADVEIEYVLDEYSLWISKAQRRKAAPPGQFIVLQAIDTLKLRTFMTRNLQIQMISYGVTFWVPLPIIIRPLG